MSDLGLFDTGLGAGSKGKDLVAEARSARQEREAKRLAEAELVVKQEATIRIYKAWKRSRLRRRIFECLRREWDRKLQFVPAEVIVPPSDSIPEQVSESNADGNSSETPTNNKEEGGGGGEGRASPTAPTTTPTKNEFAGPRRRRAASRGPTKRVSRESYTSREKRIKDLVNCAEEYLIFTHPSAPKTENDIKGDRERLTHLCKMFLDEWVKECPLNQVLDDEPSAKRCFGILQEILEKCVATVCGKVMPVSPSTNSTLGNDDVDFSLYLSGPELRFMIMFLDAKFYRLSLQSSIVEIQRSLVTRGLLTNFRNGLVDRVKSLVNARLKRSRDSDIRRTLPKSLSTASAHGMASANDAHEKMEKSTMLWINTIVHLTFVVLTQHKTIGEDNADSRTDFTPSDLLLFAVNVLSVPLISLCISFGAEKNPTNATANLFRNSEIMDQLFTLCLSGSSNNAGFLKSVCDALEGEGVLYLVGNIVLFYKGLYDNSSSSSSTTTPIEEPPQLPSFIQCVSRLLDQCRSYVSEKANNKTNYHALFSWYSGAPVPSIPTSFLSLLQVQLSHLWSSSFLKMVFAPVLSFNISESEWKNVDTATATRWSQISIDIRERLVLYKTLIQTVINCKRMVLMSLAYIPSFVVNLWKLMTVMGGPSIGGSKHNNSSSNSGSSTNGEMDYCRAFLKAAVSKNPESEYFMPVLEVFCECCYLLMLTVDDEELYESFNPFTPTQLRSISLFLNAFCFDLIWSQSPVKEGAASSSGPSGPMKLLSNTLLLVSSLLNPESVPPQTSKSSSHSINTSLSDSELPRPIVKLIETAVPLLELLHDRNERCTRKFTLSNNVTSSTASAPNNSYTSAIKGFFQGSSNSNAYVDAHDGFGFVEKTQYWLRKEVSNQQFLDDVGSWDSRAMWILGSLPWSVPFRNRVEVFRGLIKADKATLIQDTLYKITVKRERILEEGFRQLQKLKPSQFKHRIVVKMVNQFGLEEAGIDQNGVFKEFLTDLLKMAFSPEFGLFKSVPLGDGAVYINPLSSVHEDHLELFQFIGRMLGKAIYEGIVIDIPFPLFFYGKLLGRYSFIHDLPTLDAQLYKNLTFLKRYAGDAEELGLTFTMDEDRFGSLQTTELKPNGKATSVTNANRIEYIYLMADYRLNRQCRDQANAFISGFKSIIEESWLKLFSPLELQKLMSGEFGDFHLDDLRRHTQYEGGYFEGHPTIRSLWKVVEEFDNKDKAAFLKFVTSCSKPPVGGFKYLSPPFTIRFIEDDDSTQNANSNTGASSSGGGAGNASSSGTSTPVATSSGRWLGSSKEPKRLPSAATCFNVLKLPSYSKKSTLKEKLTYSIRSGAGFELS